MRDWLWGCFWGLCVVVGCFYIGIGIALGRP